MAAVGSVTTRLCLPIAGVALALVTERNGWALLNLVPPPAWFAFVAALLALDLAQYALHRMVHAVPAFWRVHQGASLGR